MKRFYYFICVSFMLAFFSCSSGGDGIDDIDDIDFPEEPDNGSNAEAIQEAYEQAFEKTFGEVSERCDWGFDWYKLHLEGIASFNGEEGLFMPWWVRNDQWANISPKLFQNITTPNRQTFDKWEQFCMYIPSQSQSQAHGDGYDIKVNIKTRNNEWLTVTKNGSFARFIEGGMEDFFIQYPNENGTVSTASDYHLAIFPYDGRLFTDDWVFIGFDVDGDKNYDDYVVGVYSLDGIGFLVEETSDNPDFDFNDLAFTVGCYTKDDVAYIRYNVMAVGTTQPVYINGGKEIHSMFDVPLSKKINVGDKLEYLPLIYTERFYGELKVKIGDYTYDFNDLMYRKGYVPNVLCCNWTSLYYCTYEEGVEPYRDLYGHRGGGSLDE